MKIVDSFAYEDIQAFRFGFSPFGKPKLFAYIYYIDGMLIDTGQSNMRKEVLEQVKDLPVEKIFITHRHEDHTGNLNLLYDYFKCPVYASDRCRQYMQAPQPITFAQKITWGDRPPFEQLTVVEDRIETNKYSFELIPIPGHADDMLALYEPSKQWLFSADLYLNSYIGYFITEESIADQIRSIENVLKLDFEVLLCAHKPQLRQGREKLTKKLRFLKNFYGDVAELGAKGYTAQQIFRKLKLKEDWVIRLLSGGDLSKLNMVKSVLRDESVISDR